MAGLELKMVALVEDQIHQHFKNLEEERCRKLEAAYQLEQATKHMTVERRAVPKPWKRSGEHALCEDPDLLVLATEYDYELQEEAFRQYCVARGRLHVAGEPGSRRWDYFVEHTRTKDEYLADPYFHFAATSHGEPYRFTDGELEIGWRIIRLGRATLQDCWELYRRGRRPLDTPTAGVPASPGEQSA